MIEETRHTQISDLSLDGAEICYAGNGAGGPLLKRSGTETVFMASPETQQLHGWHGGLPILEVGKGRFRAIDWFNQRLLPLPSEAELIAPPTVVNGQILALYSTFIGSHIVWNGQVWKHQQVFSPRLEGSILTYGVREGRRVYQATLALEA